MVVCVHGGEDWEVDTALKRFGAEDVEFLREDFVPGEEGVGSENGVGGGEKTDEA